MSAPDTTALSRVATEQRPAVPAPVPQYAVGFEGAAAAPFSPEAAAILAAPVAEDEVEVKDNGIVYLPGVAYRRILTRAFGAGAWALAPRGPARTMGELVVYHGALYILGRYVSEAMGECETRSGMSYASSLEGARTDCLTRCCKDLGIATELWDKRWRDQWIAKYTDREYKEPRGGGKARYFYTLKAKAGSQTLVEGRNVGVKEEPTPAPKDGMKPQSEATDAQSAESPGSHATTGVPDTVTNAANADQLAEIAGHIKRLRYTPHYTKMWLKRYFDVDAVASLTSMQAAQAIERLKVMG